MLAQLGSDDDGIDWNNCDDDEEEAEDRTFLETSDPLSLAQMSSDLQEDVGDNTLTDIDNTELQVHGSPPFTDTDTNTSTTQPTATSTQPPTTSTQSPTISTQPPTISTQLTATSIQPPAIPTHPTTTSTQETATSIQVTNRIPTQPRLSTATTETPLTTATFSHMLFQEPVGPRVSLDSTSTALDAFSISIYAGASESSEGQGLGAAVVMKIAQPLLGKEHCLYYDNFFSGVELASNLLSHQTYTVSTTRTNRRGWPNSLRDCKKLNQELQRGEHKSVIVSTENGAVECLAWKDKKVVTMLNTDCNPNNTTNVKRKGRDGQSTLVSCPESVKMYNKFMGGVDLADARWKTYSCSRRSKKWWHRLFYYLVDVSVVNSYILLSESPQCASWTQKEFILELSQELMGKFNARKRPPQPSGQALPSARFDSNNYPETSDSLLQCHVCSQEGTRRRTRVCCSTCDPRNPIHLCIDPCFRIWHTEDK